MRVRVCVCACSLILAVLVAPTMPLMAEAAAAEAPAARSVRDNVVLQWNDALLDAVRATRFAPMQTARAFAVVHTAMYDAWAAYDRRAVGVHWNGSLRRPRAERTSMNVRVAVSFAAYRALTDLFPAQRAGIFDPLMAELDLDPLNDSLDVSGPQGVGNVAAAAVIAFRHADGANQLGDINGGAAYSDYTGYVPVNTPDHLIDPNKWQPLRGANNSVQTLLLPHWGRVSPFALTSAGQFQPRPPARFGSEAYDRQAEAMRRLSAHLTDRDKVIAEYWADGPSTETPPGHWALFAQHVSRRDRHTTEEDIKMFFILGNALLDASISVWECKIFYDYVRPITAVRHVFAGSMIEAWAGPYQGTQLIPGETFRPYIATPPFPEYTSGHSGFSAASAEVLKLFTGRSFLGASFTFKAGASTIEAGAMPAADVTLTWKTFEDAADQAGMSRRLGGIHFRQGDLESKAMGKKIGRQVWKKALAYFHGGRR
jgi:hypothetical protein